MSSAVSFDRSPSLANKESDNKNVVSSSLSSNPFCIEKTVNRFESKLLPATSHVPPVPLQGDDSLFVSTHSSQSPIAEASTSNHTTPPRRSIDSPSTVRLAGNHTPSKSSLSSFTSLTSSPPRTPTRLGLAEKKRAARLKVFIWGKAFDVATCLSYFFKTLDHCSNCFS